MLPADLVGQAGLFFDLKDETGLLNVTCIGNIYGRYGDAIVPS